MTNPNPSNNRSQNTNRTMLGRFDIRAEADLHAAIVNVQFNKRLREVFGAVDVAMIATVVSELGRNILKYGGGRGHLQVTWLDDGGLGGIFGLYLDTSPTAIVEPSDLQVTAAAAILQNIASEFRDDCRDHGHIYSSKNLAESLVELNVHDRRMEVGLRPNVKTAEHRPVRVLTPIVARVRVRHG